MVTDFLILHGFSGSTGGHWQEWLSQELEKRGLSVRFPQFPDWNKPDKSTWLSLLNKIMADIHDAGRLTVVAHSLGCVLWLHYAAQAARKKVGKVLLVSPPAVHPVPDSLNFFFPETSEAKDQAERAIAGFYPFPSDTGSLSAAAEKTAIITSTTDPFMPGDSILDYRAYKVPVVLLPAMGHINVRSGYGPWPWMLDACLHQAFPFA
ncbi:RBBP9/YdeN family alpha/beta hydrolase [Sporolactobacillus vineae]|uniref:RBBP9/YdeN family alpha/beta hydrolase n=1 Tax=Sporolactobacillus vineae TaxID=444463 RepID=UPI000288FCA2|nr:alpha/beta fold hydrolase [Sporolactobacillus vineae]